MSNNRNREFCPDLIAAGICADSQREKQHKIIPCELCKIFCSSPYEMKMHVEGKKHRKLLTGSQSDKKTLQNVASRIPSEKHCAVCDVNVSSKLWKAHLSGSGHTNKEKLSVIYSKPQESGGNKFDIVINESALDFGVIGVDTLRTKSSIEGAFTITLNSEAAVTFVEARLTSAAKPNTHTPFTPRFSRDARLSCGVTYHVFVDFCPKDRRGQFKDCLEFLFEDILLGNLFVITRQIRATVGTSAESSFRSPASSHHNTRPPFSATPPVGGIELVDGVQLAEVQSLAKGLSTGLVPKDVRNTLDSGSVTDKINHIRKTLLPDHLSYETYSHYWKTLLWVQELSATANLRQYDMTNVTLEAPRMEEVLYRLKVIGMAERHPSLMIGDRIRVKEHGNVGNKWFRGYVHKIQQEEVHLRFHDTFTSSRSRFFDIELELNRLSFRRMHTALESPVPPARLLFPNESYTKGVLRPTLGQMNNIQPINKLISGNSQQLMAVTAIRRLPEGFLPFLIIGPPRTGKTATIVEAIYQLVHKNPSVRILACAPSNRAADIICAHLAGMGTTQVFRLNSPTRPTSSLMPALRPFTSQKDGLFSAPSSNIIREYRVVISTCMSSTMVANVGIPSGHFTHIFIDDAGQVLEPESIVPVKILGDHATNVILSGDTTQIGPIIKPTVVQKLGLETSWLDRLQCLPIYDDIAYDGMTVVKLLKTYRSNDTILKFPKERFYVGNLKGCSITDLDNSASTQAKPQADNHIDGDGASSKRQARKHRKDKHQATQARNAAD